MSVGQSIGDHHMELMPAVPNRGLIRREALLQVLKRGFQKRLTIACAPPGSGKTVALWQATRDIRGPVAWVSLSHRQADVGAFLVCLFDMISAEFSHVPQRRLGSRPEGRIFSLDRLISEFIMWTRRVVTADTLVVLDDFDFVGSSDGVREAMRLILEQTPRTLHFVISSRVTPPLELSQLRLLGEVCEVGRDDFTLGDDEVKQVSAALGIRLTSELAYDIAQVTEGWVAGVVLICYALAKQKAKAEDVLHLGCLSLEDAWEYMKQQVLSGLDAKEQDFLMITSVFDVMEETLCNELVGGNDSGHTLDALSLSGLFTYRLPDSPAAFRHHHLLRDMLREKLRRSGRWARYTRRAGEVCHKHGRHIDAVDYFLQAGCFDDASVCILEASELMLKTGRHKSLSAWLARMPVEILTKSPRLMIVRGAALEAEGKWNHACVLYEQAATSCRTAEDREGLYYALWRMAEIARRRGDQVRCVDLCTEALTHVAEERKPERGEIHNLLAVANFALGLVDAGRRHLDLALRLQQEARDAWGTGWVLNNLAYHVYVAQGDFDGAMSAYGRALGCFSEAGSLTGAAHVKANMACACVFVGECDRALSLLSEAEEAACEACDMRTLAGIYILRGMISLKSGELDRARALIGQAAPVVDELREPVLQGVLLSLRSRISRRAGEVEEGMRLADAAAQCIEGVGSDPSALIIGLDRGAAYLDAKDSGGARLIVTEILTKSRKLQAKMAEAWSLLLLAAADFAASSEEWRALMCQAIAKIASGGYWFLPEQTPQAHGVLEAFVRRRVNLEQIEMIRQACCPSLYARLFYEQEAQPDTGLAGSQAPARPCKHADLEIYMLGGFQLALCGKPIGEAEWKTSMVKALFRYLVANADRWVPREEMLEVLWPGKRAAAALNNFNVTLHALRRVLEPELAHGADSRFIRGQAGGSYRFLPLCNYALDVDEFEGLLHQASCLEASGRSAHRFGVHRAAIEVYGGDFLPDDVYEPWTAQRRDALKEKYLGALLRLTNLLLSRHLLAEAATRARQAIKADPWREDAHRLLMVALARAGQRAKALQHFHSMEESFQGEFGVGLEDDTVQLFERISRGEST